MESNCVFHILDYRDYFMWCLELLTCICASCHGEISDGFWFYINDYVNWLANRLCCRGSAFISKGIPNYFLVWWVFFSHWFLNLLYVISCERPHLGGNRILLYWHRNGDDKHRFYCCDTELNTLGYSGYCDSREYVYAFARECPWCSLVWWAVK